MRGLENKLPESQRDGWRGEKGEPRRVRSILLVTIAATLVAGGCTTEPAADVKRTRTTEPADVGETPTPTATPLPPEGYGLLQPGTYYMDSTTVPPENSPGFDSVRITFSVPSGWDAWDLGVLKEKGAGPNPLGVDFWNVSTVPADPCHWERGGPTVGPTVDELATALANQSRRHATAPTDATLAGYAGKHLTLTVPAHIDFAGDDLFPTCDQGSFVSWDAPPTSAFGRYHQGPGQVDELWILDVHGFRLVIDAAYWRNSSARYVAEIHRIVHSVRIERPLPEASGSPEAMSP